MSRKPKFNPEITRVKLNPEQAVLACPCYSAKKYPDVSSTRDASNVCSDRNLIFALYTAGVAVS